MIGGFARGAGRPRAPRNRRPPFLPRRANAVICLFQHGGPSQMICSTRSRRSTNTMASLIPAARSKSHFDKLRGNVLGSPFKFNKSGQCGMELSELLPHTARRRRRTDAHSLDEHRVRRSRVGVAPHPQRQVPRRHAHLGLMGCLRVGVREIRICLPTSCCPIPADCRWRAKTTGSAGWLPAVFQGTTFRSGPSPVLNLRTPQGRCRSRRGSDQLRYLEQLNRAHLERHPENLGARRAARPISRPPPRMQTAVPDVLDIAGETARNAPALRTRQPDDERIWHALLARASPGRARRAVRANLSEKPTVGHAQ